VIPSNFTESQLASDGLNIAKGKPIKIAATSATSFDKISGIFIEKYGISCSFWAEIILLANVKFGFFNKLEAKYESIVFTKFEKQTSGTIMSMHLIAFVPSFVMELNIKQNITKGKKETKRSFIKVLTAYKADLTCKGTRNPKNIGRNKAAKKTVRTAKFLSLEFTKILPFRELGLFAGFSMPIFLPLNHPRVSG
jgi:hypothetical protein